MILTTIVRKKLCVPIDDFAAGNGATAARKLDVALMSIGFKLAGPLLARLSNSDERDVLRVAGYVLDAVRDLMGDHVQHNVYFKTFPAGIPDTVEFWHKCIMDALANHASSPNVAAQVAQGEVNLLDLPKYGRYLHSYEDMVKAHEEFVPLVSDRLRVLTLGGSLAQEALSLYRTLAGSRVPLNDDDRELLVELALLCLTASQPEHIPVRENKALINMVRIQNDQPMLVDAPTDILRLACALSGGDVTLEQPTRFISFGRGIRKRLLGALEVIIKPSPGKLADISQYTEAWKRLGERLHPHEYQKYRHAARAFAVARGERKERSLMSKVESAFARDAIDEAVQLLATAPGLLFRNLDRILRASPSTVGPLLEPLRGTSERVSGRVLLSVREHLQNRLVSGGSRVFANSKGKAWVTPDEREPLPGNTIAAVYNILDTEISRRLPPVSRLVVDRGVMTVALPLSEKTRASGFGVMPRGTILPVEKDTLRFFVYWKEKSQRTDYDLSAIYLDRDFKEAGQVSYTNLRSGGIVHSGDITSAPKGASEFIDIDLGKIDGSYVLPQVNVYSGDGFGEIKECFFGFMSLDKRQKGKPFEARSVKMKSTLNGNGKSALPLAFAKDDDGRWHAKWMNLFSKGQANFNRVEANRATTALQARAIIVRDYLPVSYLVGLLRRKAETFSWHDEKEKITKPVVYIGIDGPEDLPDGSQLYLLPNLRDLIPE